MYLCPNYWNKEGLNQRIKIKVCKHDVLCFMFVLYSISIKGPILEKRSRVSPAFLRFPHVLILIDFLLWDSYLSVTLSVAAAVLVTSTNFVKSSSLGKISNCTMPLIFTSSARGWQTRHWEMATGILELTERDGGGDESTSEYMCRSEWFCVRIPFAPWAMESRNQTMLFHMGTRAGWQALPRSALPAHEATLKSFTRSPQAQAGFNVLPSHPAGSGQQPKAGGQRAGRGPRTPSPVEHQETPRHFWWRLKMKSAIKKQIHRNAGETGDPNLFPWQDQAGGRAGRNICAHVS